MKEIVLLAPGPSMSQELADSLRGQCVGVVNNCFELAPWADFLAAQDRAWWRTYPAAMKFAGHKFSSNDIPGVSKVPGSASLWNSGVLALQASVYCMGATRILLYGFDMHGSHYFGKYKNRLNNTMEHQRRMHFRQYDDWARRHKDVEVVNCTPGSALKCFPMERATCAA